MIETLLYDSTKKARYIRSWIGKRLVHTNLQLLYNCNFRCKICDYWRPEQRGRPQLSLQQVRTISDKLAQVGPQLISIGGGEPLMHPQIIEVVRALSKHHFPVMICNGWFITPENARALWEAGMYEISVSVDYLDPAKHDAQRGVPGAWERAVRALDVLFEQRTHSEQRVHMISVIMDDNLDDVEPLIQLSRERGFTYLLTLYSDGRGEKARREIADDVTPRLLALKERYPEFVVLRDYVAGFSQAIRDGGIGGCRCGKNLCNIDSQGDVSLCIDRLDESVGNLLTDSMEVIEQRLLERYHNNSCKECWTSCRGNIETIMYGDRSLANLWDYWQLTKPVGLA
jgi:MoaA/NifB/PqqE/SkfB family radical SAM enzyme